MASITSRLLCMNIYSYLDGRHEVDFVYTYK